MEKMLKITDSEWQLMDLIWQYMETKEDAAGVTQPYLMEQLANKWNKNTVHTFLKRLCDKGYLEVVKETSPHRYKPLINRLECEQEERKSFLERVYQGSTERMVAAFIRDGVLNKAEADKLRKLLEEVK